MIIFFILWQELIYESCRKQIVLSEGAILKHKEYQIKKGILNIKKVDH